MTIKELIELVGEDNLDVHIMTLDVGGLEYDSWGAMYDAKEDPTRVLLYFNND